MNYITNTRCPHYHYASSSFCFTVEPGLLPQNIAEATGQDAAQDSTSFYQAIVAAVAKTELTDQNRILARLFPVTFFVSEYCAGGNLEEYVIKLHGKMEDSKIKDVAKQMLVAISALLPRTAAISKSRRHVLLRKSAARARSRALPTHRRGKTASAKRRGRGRKFAPR
jgi:hypothetical protein